MATIAFCVGLGDTDSYFHGQLLVLDSRVLILELLSQGGGLLKYCLAMRNKELEIRIGLSLFVS